MSRISRNVQNKGKHTEYFDHGDAPYVPPARGGMDAERKIMTEWLKRRGLNENRGNRKLFVK